MANVTKTTEYKGEELKVTVEMDAMDCYPVFSEFEFTQPNDKLFRELNEKTDNQLHEIFNNLNWEQEYYEYVQESREFNAQKY